MNMKLYIDIGVTCPDKYNPYMIELNIYVTSVTLHLLRGVPEKFQVSLYDYCSCHMDDRSKPYEKRPLKKLWGSKNQEIV